MDAKYFVKFNCTIFKPNFREIHIFIETRESKSNFLQFQGTVFSQKFREINVFIYLHM